MSLRRFLATACLLSVLVGTAGCGPSEGQNITMYLGSVTIHERRLQASADQLEELVPRLRAVPPDFVGVRDKVRAIQGSVREGKAEVDKLQPPASAADLHKLYTEAFQVAAERVDGLAQILAEEETLRREQGTSGAEAVQKRVETLRAELQELGTRAEGLDEKIRQGKIALAQRYPEVQVPEADPPASPAAVK